MLSILLVLSEPTLEWSVSALSVNVCVVHALGIE